MKKYNWKKILQVGISGGIVLTGFSALFIFAGLSVSGIQIFLGSVLLFIASCLVFSDGIGL